MFLKKDKLCWVFAALIQSLRLDEGNLNVISRTYMRKEKTNHRCIRPEKDVHHRKYSED